MERGTVRVKCLAQQHNTMFPAKARTRTARSGVERTNHEAIAPQLRQLYKTLIDRPFPFPERSIGNCGPPSFYLFTDVFCFSLPVDIFPEHCSNPPLYHMVEDLNPLWLQIVCLPLNKERKFLSKNVYAANMIPNATLWLVGSRPRVKNCGEVNANNHQSLNATITGHFHRWI